ncbi:hypothetical protein Kpol_1001p31 [Vanderwaltozyma polyspora DSM 70294]|uniref:Uncharacterized protein n=1 Tax=Vanderwaltozyma polyspora (strain ATCC 22028 / DSM 70294 / BCRC 21397 / CBS 2163 / NBRC 10782 / NRRL Y-8283 / UCD 57-17) TaxID=436907 RepID=A7TNR8_VANPO|nr:uncharacterized protein Kpol_1001p31 [Vanderwaltozyma polyspora DSM 70294]EDO16119.1 hypothetical protein Kpol_1001p31 [Vanderwaltozyma polyspora DSM 70294]
MAKAELKNKKSISIFHGKGVKSSISQTFSRWRSTFKKITQETLNSLDNGSMNDDKVEALFQADDSSVSTSDPNSEGTSYASNSMPPNLGAAVEMRLTDETESFECSDSSSDEDDSDSNIETFSNYNATEKCKELRHELGEPFCSADIIWKRRRELWTEINETNNDISGSEKRKQTFEKIPADYYPRVYKKLVIDDKPLKDPLNLEDAIQVINSGWTETKKWATAANGLG